MSDRPLCDETQLELSVAHDEGRRPSERARLHVNDCPICSGFAVNLIRLDGHLARGDVRRSPQVVTRVTGSVTTSRNRWWAVAAVGMVGIAIGAVMAGVGSLDVVQAHDLDERFHAASPSITGLTADVVVVERGWHPDVPERVWSGVLGYGAPEGLMLRLDDTTSYPSEDWTPNDVELLVLDGDMVARASSPCPLEALPDCQRPPTVTAFRDLRPFDPGVLAPLELVGPTGTFSWWSGITVIGFPDLAGQETIQVEATVAGVELLSSITEYGSWRDLHPTDRVVMWLDQTSLVPLRVEVFALDSTERELWAVRRGYTDPTDEPLFIVALSGVTMGAPELSADVPEMARSGGFEDGPANVPSPVLDEGFELHRTGRWQLADGGVVEVSSWSDGRSWVMVEATGAWRRPNLFGISSPFARPVDLDGGSVAYLEPSGRVVALHSDDLDVVVSGSLPTDTLLTVAASLGVDGSPVPHDWAQADSVEALSLPAGTLVPDVEGWSMLGTSSVDRTEIRMTGTGARQVSIVIQPGERLAPPIGPDVVAVNVRSTTGRYDARAATLEWVENGRVVQMQSETVSLHELEELATAMSAR